MSVHVRVSFFTLFATILAKREEPRAVVLYREKEKKREGESARSRSFHAILSSKRERDAAAAALAPCDLFSRVSRARTASRKCQRSHGFRRNFLCIDDSFDQCTRKSADVVPSP